MEATFELVELRTFVAAAERGSILGAAETLGTSRGRVRRHLDNLESVLGSPLFDRTREGFALSAEGKLLLNRAKSLLGDARQLVREFHEVTIELQGVIRLGLQVGYPTRLSLAINEYLHQVFGQTQIINRIAERPVELLPDKVDLVICLGEQTPTMPCVAFEVARIQEQLWARRSYLTQIGRPKSIEEVRGALLGAWRGPSEEGDRIHLLSGETIACEAKLRTSDEQYLKLVALRQDGFIYAPLPPTPVDPEMEELEPVLTELVGRTLVGRVFIPEALAKAPRYEVLVRTLREFMADAEPGSN